MRFFLFDLFEEGPAMACGDPVIIRDGKMMEARQEKQLDKGIKHGKV